MKITRRQLRRIIESYGSMSPAGKSLARSIKGKFMRLYPDAKVGIDSRGGWITVNGRKAIDMSSATSSRISDEEMIDQMHAVYAGREVDSDVPTSNSRMGTFREGKLTVSESKLRRMVRAAILAESTEMLDIVVNPYEDVTDINRLANYALRGDMQGALQDVHLKKIIDSNNADIFVDQSYDWLKMVGDERQMGPAPSGWNLKDVQDFFDEWSAESTKISMGRDKDAHSSSPNAKERELIGKVLTRSFVLPGELPEIEFQVRRRSGKPYNINLEDKNVTANIGPEDLRQAGLKIDDVIQVLRNGGAKERKKQAPRNITPPMYD